MRRMRNQESGIRNLTGQRLGMSLLEVFVALAIFIAALAVITQIIATGSKASVTAQLQSEATLRAESCMAEVIAGVIKLETDSRPFDDDPTWTWSLTLGDGPHADTMKLTVAVTHRTPQDRVNAQASLCRMIRDPNIYTEAAGASSTTNPLDLLK